MKDYKIEGKVIRIEMENGKKYMVATDWVNNTMKNLDTDMEDVLLMWLEDNEYLVNEEQEELNKQAKGVVKVNATDKAKKKTPKERVQKENPTKEKIIQNIAETLKNLGVSNLNIENKAKLITFSLDNEDFKVDLIQKRKPKSEKEQKNCYFFNFF